MGISTSIATVVRLVPGGFALLAAPFALALSLGDAAPQSSLGQPLRVAVPIAVTDGQSLDAPCVHVIADAAGGSGPPRLLTGRVTIDRSAAGSQLLVTTTRPVNEPVVRLAVQAGCVGTIRRDFVLLLDPAAVGAKASVAQRNVDTRPVVAAAAAPHAMKPTAKTAPAFVRVAAEAHDVVSPAPKTAAVEAARQPPIMLSSPGGSSFIPEASAAGFPRAVSSPQAGMTPADVEPVVAPWWPLAAALLVVAALARWLVPMRRRSAVQAPAWAAPTARTEPNPSVSGKPPSNSLSKTGHFAAMTEPGTGFPRGVSKSPRSVRKAEGASTRPQTVTTKSGTVKEDPRFADFDADLIEEQTIRAEWAKAVNDGAIDIGGDSILKAIDDAERAIQGAPAHPAQVALDRSLDDELLPNKTRR